MSRGVEVLSGGVPPPGTAPMDGGRGKPLPYKRIKTLPISRRGAPWGSRQDTHQERWLGKARRSSESAAVKIFVYPGPVGRIELRKATQILRAGNIAKPDRYASPVMGSGERRL